MGGSRVDLTRAADPEIGIAVQLDPLGDPTGQPAQSKERREHIRRRSDRVVDHARVEVHVRVQFPLDEVVVLEGDLFEFHRDLEKRAVDAKLVENVKAGLLDDARSGIEVLVDPMAKAHEPRGVVIALCSLDELPPRHALVPDGGEHVDDLLVGSTVQRTPKRIDPRRNRPEKIDHGRTHQASRRGRAVLFVVGMKNKQQVEGLADHFVDLVLLAWVAKHHPHEVAHVVEAVVRVHEGLAHRVLIGVGGEGGEFRDESVHRDLDLVLVAGVEGIGIESGECTHRSGTGRHGVRILGERGVEFPEVLVEHGVVVDRIGEVVELVGVGQVAVHQQVRDLKKIRFFGEFLDGDAAIAKDALLAVDECDRALAGTGIRVAGIQGDAAGFRSKPTDIDGAFAFAARDHGKLDGLVTDAEFCCLGHFGCIGHEGAPPGIFVAGFDRGVISADLCVGRRFSATGWVLDSSQPPPYDSVQAAR